MIGWQIGEWRERRAMATRLDWMLNDYKPIYIPPYSRTWDKPVNGATTQWPDGGEMDE